MYKDKNILCTICARGGSKGVNKKNISLINRKPLIAYSIESAIKSQAFEEVVVSTDCDEIMNASKKFGAKVFFQRPENLSLDSTPKLPVIKHAFISSEKYFKKKFDVLVDLDATSPLRKTEDILNCIDLLIKNNHSNIITATPSRRSPYFNIVEKDFNGFWNVSKKNPTETISRRQDSPKCFDMNASIYVWNRNSILNNESVFQEKTGLYVMPEERSIDIDSPLDFKLVSFLLQENN